MATIAELLLQKPHSRRTCPDLVKYAVKLERGKRNARNRTAERTTKERANAKADLHNVE